jgi:hypothetical protein
MTTVGVFTAEQIKDLVREGVALYIAQVTPADPAVEPERWLDYKAAAATCGCSPSTLRRRVEAGQLPVSIALGRPRFKLSDIRRLLDAGVPE